MPGLGGVPGAGVPGAPQIPPPPGGLGSGLLALGSVAGALVGHQGYPYNQLKEDKDVNDRRTVSFRYLLSLFIVFKILSKVFLKND